MTVNLKKESQEIYERNTLKVRSDVAKNWNNVMTACDYLEKQGVEITVMRVVRHVKEVIKSKPATQEHFYRKSQEYGRYVQTRAREQAGSKSSKYDLPKQTSSFDNLMAIPKEELVRKLLYAQDDTRHIKRDNDRLREAFGKLELNPENHLSNIAGNFSEQSAEYLLQFMRWLVRCGLQIKPLALVFYDEDGTQVSRLSNEDIVRHIAQLCNVSVEQLLLLTEPEKE